MADTGDTGDTGGTGDTADTGDTGDTGDGPNDDERLAGYGRALSDAVEAHLGGWVQRSVDQRLADWGGRRPLNMASSINEAARSALEAVLPRLAELAGADAHDMRETPLSILRSLVAYPTAVLAGAGVPPVVRDEFDRDRFPDDLYGLNPANLADIDPELGTLGVEWGAARAFVLASRRRVVGG